MTVNSIFCYKLLIIMDLQIRWSGVRFLITFSINNKNISAALMLVVFGLKGCGFLLFEM